MKASIAVGVIVVVLTLPAAIKTKGHEPLIGPSMADIDYTEVSFTNRTDSLRLAGMLLTPDGAGPYPATVIIHGSGASTRDNTWYLAVAEALRSNGIVVLLPDKRGSEKSEGSWVTADAEDLANDALAAINYLLDQRLFDVERVGILGMSQGGWIAPVVASHSDDVSFVVSMVGPTVTFEEHLRHEETYNIEPYTYTFLARAIAPFTAARLAKLDVLQPWVGYDPLPYWKSVEAPVFFAFGGDDRNVPVEASIQRLEVNDLAHHRIETYDSGGHAIRDPETNEVSRAYLEDLVDFILTAPEP